MESHLRAGIAIFNAGGYHTAHDAWEEYWLDLESGAPDEQFLHGLIQYTAAVHHARNRNWSGATGLAESAVEYLADLPATYRDVNVGSVRTYLDELGSDPELIERRRPLQLTHRGERLSPSDLAFDGTAIAAEALAEKRAEEPLIDDAIEYARADVGGTEESARGETDSRILPLVFDYVRDGEHRDLIVNRLEQHVDKRRARENDVSGLFEER